MNKKLIILALLLGTILVMPSNLVFAAPEAGTGQALEIAPPVISLTGDPGQILKSEINLKSVSTVDMLITNQINDFSAADEQGSPRLMIDENGQPTGDSPYSLREWIDSFSEIILKPREMKKLPVIINIPTNASPGGYYSIVRFTGTPPELEGTGVSLTASIGAMIFVRVNGKANDQLSLKDFYASANSEGSTKDTIIESLPVTFIVRLENTGNIYEQPVGQISITDMFGSKVADVNVNISKNNILPGSIRKFTQKLDSSVIGNRILFGLYKAELNLKYGDNNESVKSNIQFWVIPYRLIALGIIIVVGGFFILRHSIRRYNKHIIYKANKRK